MESVITLITRLLISPLSKSNQLQAATTLYGICKGYSLSNIQALIKQSALETGYWNDYKFQQHNNAFGMLEPSWSPYTTGSVGTEGQGIYENVVHCVLDRLTWDKRNGINPRSRTYLTDVQQAGYNGSSSYPAHIQAFEPQMLGYWYALALLPTALTGILYLIR